MNGIIGNGRRVNCWEFRKCGFGPSSGHSCAVLRAYSFQGINGGTQGGRFCWVVRGTLCDQGKEEHDLNFKKVNCISCDFFKHVRKEEGDNFQHALTTSLVDDPREIAATLLKAHENSWVVEVQMNHRPPKFYTSFQDVMDPVEEECSEPLEQPDYGSGEPMASYRPFDYLKFSSHLILSPLFPAIGNAKIRNSEGLTLSFYDGVTSIEAQVTYLGLHQAGDSVGLLVSYPQRLTAHQKRRHVRFSIPDSFTVKVELYHDGSMVKAREILDISVSGMALELKDVRREGSCQEEDLIQVALEHEELGKVSLLGKIRWLTKTGLGRDGAQVKKMGVEFHFNETKDQRKVAELVSLCEREYLQQVGRQRLRRRELQMELRRS